jgi:uncharacterized iron-regulated protein
MKPPLPANGRRPGRVPALLLGALYLGLAACAGAPPKPPVATTEVLAQVMARQPIVLLGEVHDNAAQHVLRLQALRRRIGDGARPALAFEQLDADRQAALERARAGFDPSADLAARVSVLIEVAGARGWNWDYYRPYLALALENQLPIVAANLSRAQAMRVAQEGLAAAFDARQQAELGLDDIAADIVQAQRHEIDLGHCGRVPPDDLTPMALAQVARDARLAQSIAPYADRGVVLLTGNGHARRDIGVIRHLPAKERSRAISIGLLEDDDKALEYAAAFDVALLTPVQARADPCRALPAGSIVHSSGGRRPGLPPSEPEAFGGIQY